MDSNETADPVQEWNGYVYTNKEKEFELMTMREAIGDINPCMWLVDDFIPLDGTGMLFGASGVGKTFVALDISLHVASGKQWHGHALKQGPVIYIKAEGHSQFASRIDAWYEKNKNSHLPFDPRDTFFLSKVAANFSEREFVSEVIHSIKKTIASSGTMPVLVVIDTLAKSFVGDENSSRDMSEFLYNVDTILRNEIACTVMLVHHTGHGNKDRSRGSSALTAALDFEFLCESQGEKELNLVCTKMKDAKKPTPIAFIMNVVEINHQKEDGSNMSSIVLSPTEFVSRKETSKSLGRKQLAMMEILCELTRKHEQTLIDGGLSPDAAKVTILDWKDTAIKKGVLKSQYAKQDIYKIKKALLEKNLISTDGVYVKAE